MTKRALKRLVREGEFDATQFGGPFNGQSGGRFGDDDKIRRLPVERAWSPLGPPQGEAPRDQSYVKTLRPKSIGPGAPAGRRRRQEPGDGAGSRPVRARPTWRSPRRWRRWRAGSVGRIVLSRPAVEAGETLGFLPGDMEDKLAPYLRPLYDALSDRLSMKRVKGLMAEGLIEIAPIGFMRGRTLNNAFVVIDEAQNCTYGQLKMLLTRLGWNSTMVITGDPAQSDLLPGISGPRPSGRAAGDGWRTWRWCGWRTWTSCATRWWRKCWACSEGVAAKRRRRLIGCRCGRWRRRTALAIGVPVALGDPVGLAVAVGVGSALAEA